MKKQMFKWLFVLLAAVVCVGVTSCTDDDDDDVKKENVGNSLVGTWKCTWDDDEWEILTFNANGTGKIIYYDGYYSEYESYSFSWVMTGDTLIVKVVDGDEVETDVFEVMVSGNMLILSDDYGDSEVYYRQ